MLNTTICVIMASPWYFKFTHTDGCAALPESHPTRQVLSTIYFV